MSTATPTGTSYLTVQDMLWINLQVTLKTNPFAFDKLEQATFYQYGYGPSFDVVGQAANFLKGFMKDAPFSAGNDATAFVGFVAFVALNGYELNLPDAEAGAWVKRIKDGDVDAGQAVASLTKMSAGHHEGEPQVCMQAALDAYPATVEALA